MSKAALKVEAHEMVGREKLRTEMTHWQGSLWRINKFLINRRQRTDLVPNRSRGNVRPLLAYSQGLCNSKAVGG